MDNTFAFLIAAGIILLFVLNYLRKQKQIAAKAREAAEKGKLFSQGPQSQHPHIDANYCIGCAACTMVCPEGDVLAMLGGKAVIVYGYKCIGHSLCAEVCPVGAITMVLASPSMRSEEHTSELQSHSDLVCRLLLEKKKGKNPERTYVSRREYAESLRAKP